MREMRQVSEAKIRRAFIAADIRISIDDINLMITAQTGNIQCSKFYEVEHIPTDVLAFIHRMES